MKGPVLLGKEVRFPDPRLSARSGPARGLVGVGGDLSVPRLLLAYRSGIFPWTDSPITWWSPDPRAVLELDRLHTPRSLKAVLRKRPFQVTVDRAFRAVMEGCAEPAPGREETWISSQFLEGYTRLHEAGHAHSLEVWRADALVGGIYGVAIGGFFAGESMFHRESNASKVALWHLAQLLREGGFVLFDVQVLTPATSQMGGVTIPREDYLRRLTKAVKLSATFPCSQKEAGPRQTLPPKVVR
jgi:leucyl/phenylalanyl-tRNA---protein transferase